MIIDTIDWTNGTWTPGYEPMEHMEGLTLNYEPIDLEDDLMTQRMMRGDSVETQELIEELTYTY